MADKTRHRIGKILQSYFFEQLPQELERDILSWLAHSGHEEEKWDELENIWDKIVAYEEQPVNSEQILERLEHLKQTLGLPPVTEEMLQYGRPKRKNLARKIMWRAAAVVLPLLIATGVWFFTAREITPAIEQYTLAATDIPAEIVLPDGTQVWLKSRSTLTYPERFEDTRSVRLEGEAYFSVMRDEQKPFVVNTDKLSVRVLGTEFNVLDNPLSKQAAVTLNSGKVEVSIGDNTYLMDQRGQLLYDQTTNTVKTEQIAAGISSDWRTKQFDRTSLEEVFKTLSERYNIPIERDPAAISGESVTIRLEGDEPLEVVLSHLSAITRRFTYRIDDNKVIVQTSQVSN